MFKIKNNIFTYFFFYLHVTLNSVVLFSFLYKTFLQSYVNSFVLREQLEYFICRALLGSRSCDDLPCVRDFYIVAVPIIYVQVNILTLLIIITSLILLSYLNTTL